MARLAHRPEFTIILYGESSDVEMAQSFESVSQQIYPHRTVSVVDPSAGWEQAISDASGDFIVPLRAGDRLSPTALIRYAAALEASPDALVVFGDQDSVDQGGERTSPWFKPSWNRELFLAQDYLSDASAVRTEAARKAMKGGRLDEQVAAYDLLLRVTRDADAVLHAPFVTVHVRTELRADDQGARVEVTRTHLAGTAAEASAGSFGTVKVDWPLPSALPTVSIIIPTRDKVELLRACVDSLLAETSYSPFEVLIVDNGSTEAGALAYLAGSRRIPAFECCPTPGPTISPQSTISRSRKARARLFASSTTTRRLSTARG